MNELVQHFNHQRLSILNRYQLTEQDAAIVRYLSEHEMQKMKQVGEYFHIKLSTLTSIIDKLERSGLVKRRNSKEDRRVIYINVTGKGNNMLQDLQQSARGAAASLSTDMPPGEYATFLQGLEHLLEQVKK